jgi:hypothetical protein
MAVGRVLNKMMGIEKGQDLPTPLPGSDDFWLDVNGESLLRPKFEASWTANIKWHTAFVTKFKNDAHTIDPYCPKSIIDNIDKTKLKKVAGNTTFKNLKLKYKEQERPTAIQEHNVQEDRRDDRKMKANLMSHCVDRFIDTLIIQKAAARKDVRETFHELSGLEYDFIFNFKWQSTDASASTAPSAKEDAIKNAAAAAEDDAADGATCHKVYKKRKKSNVWTTRSPNFRSQQVRHTQPC